METENQHFYRVTFRLNDKAEWRLVRVGIPSLDMAWEAATCVGGALRQIGFNTARAQAELDSDNIPLGTVQPGPLPPGANERSE